MDQLIPPQLLQQVYDLMDQCDREDELANQEFHQIVQQNEHYLQIQLGEMNEVKHQIQMAQQRAQSLSNNISSIHQLAENVTSTVRQLDLIQSRVKEALIAIEGNIGLKSCLQGVDEAIKDEDYEKAAQYIDRVFTLNEQQQLSQQTLNTFSGDSIGDDDIVLNGGGGGGGLSTNMTALKQSHDKMIQITKMNFESSLHGGNWHGVERFAKLFTPLRIEHDGLQIFVQFLLNQTREEILREVLNREKLYSIRMSSMKIEMNADQRFFIDNFIFCFFLFRKSKNSCLQGCGSKGWWALFEW